MRIKKVIVILIIIAVGALLILRKKKELSRAPAFGQRPALVAVAFSQKRTIKNFREYLATVEPINKADVSTRINAVVEKVLVDEGTPVKKGDLLVVLDKKDITAKLNSAQEQLLAAEENFSYWQKEYSREENLFKAGAISQEERDRARNSFAQAKARRQNAQQSVQFWKANLAYAEIRSPYDGIVSFRFVDPGDLAQAGKPLVTVEDRSQLKLAFDIPQKDIPLIKKGALVFYKAKRKYSSIKVTNIFPTVSAGKIIHIEAYLTSKEGLKCGEFVPVKVQVAQKDNAVVVPQSAICRIPPQKPFVFIVKNNRLKKVPVILGLASEEEVEVKNLPSGQIVVKNPYLSWVGLFAGERVKIINLHKAKK